MTGYAQIDVAPAGRQVIGIDVSAANWRSNCLDAAFRWSLYVWLLGGLPLAAMAVLRRQLRQQDEIRNLSEAMDQSHAALMIVALDRKITYVNAGLCRQSGYARDELVGREWRGFLSEEASPHLLE